MSDSDTQMSGVEPGNRPDVSDRDTTPEEEQLAQADRADVDAAGGDDATPSGVAQTSATAGGDTDTSPAAERASARAGEPPRDPATDPGTGTGTEDSGVADVTPTPRGLDTDAQSVPEPYQPVPGVEDGTRSRQVAGTDGENDIPPVGDAAHGGDTPPSEPPD